MGSRVEEYLRRMRERGYQDSLMGMDDDDIEWELSKMEEADRRREAQPPPPLRTVYRPVDPGLKARILRMFGQPYDESAIPEEQKFYLNGWDNGEDESSSMQSGSRRSDWRDGGNSAQGMNGSRGGNEKTNWWVDLKGMYPTNFLQNQPQAQQSADVPSAPKHPQALWDEHIWKSPEVISAQTPHEKRSAVNKIINERRGEFDAAYNAAYGENAAGRWDNDRKFTLNAMGDYVSADQLKKFGWQNVDDNMVRGLNEALVKYEITTPARIRHFLAQAAKESGKGYYTTEEGDRNYFIENYWDDEERRNDLGNLSPEDAVNFRGGGYIQTTGRKNYEAFKKEVDDNDVLKRGADYISEKYPWIASGFWWKNNNMNAIVDELDGKDHDVDVDKVTDVVNRGETTKRRQDRKNLYKELLSIISD
jgi:predicted chitinase